MDLSEHLSLISEGRHEAPDVCLGVHNSGDTAYFRVYLPNAQSVVLARNNAMLDSVDGTYIYQWIGPRDRLSAHPQVTWTDAYGEQFTEFEPYSFKTSIEPFDLHLFAQGKHHHAQSFLGAHPMVIDNVAGTRFAVWAPNAVGVSVVGHFNGWNDTRHALRRIDAGVWELFIPGVGANDLYKFAIRESGSPYPSVRSDPFAKHTELRPANGSIVLDQSKYSWNDSSWCEKRAHKDWRQAPMSIYEIHLGSWCRKEDGGFVGYRELGDSLVAHVLKLGFTHVELLPVSEHPLDQSWGYQSTGFFAPTSRHGHPDDLRFLIDQLHQNGIGVIVDWVPAHFPRNSDALAKFDGTALYEHEDPRRGAHRGWGTLIFNYGRHEVRSFLISSALNWVENFHIDGIRVDAVSSMLYLNYEREEGDWVPNEHGGVENLEAVSFFRDLNHAVQSRHPGTLMIAEESTSWPQVTRPQSAGGLGFSMKWNMGWMHDTLDYFSLDPLFRKHHHDKLTFGITYADTENFVLPFSHDEVVHGKSSLLSKMPGDDWQMFANLRALLVYQFTYPGKKLLFMGADIAARREWDESRSLDWHLLDYPPHMGIQRLLGDLNRLYTSSPTLYENEFSPHDTFEWIDCHDFEKSIICYLRRDRDDNYFAVCINLTPVPREAYRIGVPRKGPHLEILNSDSDLYGGSNVGNLGRVRAKAEPWMGRDFSIELTLPPLAAIVLTPERAEKTKHDH